MLQAPFLASFLCWALLSWENWEMKIHLWPVLWLPRSREALPDLMQRWWWKRSSWICPQPPRAMQSWRDPSGTEIWTLSYGEVNLTPSKWGHQERHQHRKFVVEFLLQKRHKMAHSLHTHNDADSERCRSLQAWRVHVSTRAKTKYRICFSGAVQDEHLSNLISLDLFWGMI